MRVGRKSFCPTLTKTKNTMKKNYSTPETAFVNVLVDSFICEGTQIPVDRNPGTPAANRQQGAWGDVWKK